MKTGIRLLGGFADHERKGGRFQTGYEVYGTDGIAPTILANGGGYGIMIAEVRVIGQMDNTADHTFESANRVYDKEGLCPTLPTCGGGNEQTLEINGSGSTNALTTVQKDNLVLEKSMDETDKKPFIVDASNKRKIDGDVCGTLTAHGNTSSTHCETFLVKEDRPPAEQENASESREQYRIRKLTPRECWRLMGFSDRDLGQAKSVVSSTQLYKQAGNSIVKQVLMAIFLQLNIQGIKNWNDRTDGFLNEQITKLLEEKKK